MSSGTLQPKQIVWCSIGGQWFSFDAETVGAVTNLARFQAEPTASGQLGFLAESDRRIPVFDLLFLTGGAHSTVSKDGHLLTFTTLHGTWAFYLDKVMRVTKIAPEQVFPLPRGLEGRVKAVDGLVQVEETWCWRIAIERFRPETGAFAWVSGKLDRQKARTGPLKPLDLTTQSTALPNRLFYFLLPNYTEVICAVLPSQVVHISMVHQITEVPGTEPGLLGVIKWRNDLVPVIDLRQYWGLPAVPLDGETMRFLFMQGTKTGALVAVPVDAQVGVRSLPEQATVQNAACLPIKLTGIRGTFSSDMGWIVIPDLDQMVFNETPN